MVLCLLLNPVRQWPINSTQRSWQTNLSPELWYFTVQVKAPLSLQNNTHASSEAAAPPCKPCRPQHTADTLTRQMFFFYIYVKTILWFQKINRVCCSSTAALCQRFEQWRRLVTEVLISRTTDGSECHFSSHTETHRAFRSLHLQLLNYQWPSCDLAKKLNNDLPAVWALHVWSEHRVKKVTGVSRAWYL